MAAQEARIVFMPSGRRGSFPVGTPVLQAARALGVDIDSVCGGRGLCGRCQVTVAEGQFAKHGITSNAHSVSPSGEKEAAFERRRGALKVGRRLSCSTLIAGDCVIDVPAESQVHQQVVRKRAEQFELVLDPSVRLHTITVSEPDMHEPAADLQRLKAALRHHLTSTLGMAELPADFAADLSVVQALQAALRKGHWTVTVALFEDQQLIAVWPGQQEHIYGMAVDVGSTTIAAHLCNLQSGEVVASSGCMNPQIRFGEDLMSRVSYVMMNAGGEHEMTQAVQQALNELAQNLAQQAGVVVTDILEVTMVGNPIMHHLLLGINPVELGGAPFALAMGESLAGLKTSEVNLHLHPGARLYVLPCIAGHVGADTAAVTLAETPYLNDELTLLVDVGTNAEIVLGYRDRLMACSSPTGPAFEGAQISCGQRAAAGAIERVRIDPETLEPRFKVIGCELWSDAAGFAEQTQATGITGVCGSGIIEVIGEMYIAGIITPDGIIDGALAARSERIVASGRTWSYVLCATSEQTLMITQNDVRAIQLAKAALYAGIRLLMERMAITQVDRIGLAGAFGSHIDVKYALVLGMLPDCPLAQVRSVGNAAGSGARIALLNRAARREIEQQVRRIEKIETAVEPKFQEHFVEAMAIPHKTDPFTRLRAEVAMPAFVAPAAGGGADRGARRRRRLAS